LFPDSLHIKTLRETLWAGREYGRASVFVGAGFSMNAEPAKTNPRPFPLWSNVTKALIENLRLPDSEATPPGHFPTPPSFGTSDTLRIAQEYEAAHGRQKLEQLLLNLIPDQEWEPGRLHNMLLSLPWADVFTTNYDTLLERSAKTITERRYSLVQVATEIPFAPRPRLVKLHGSFPSIRPFIFTEDDYRTYPRSFPPFVNLVQQSIMETLLCIIGFSGDDPNFLHWTGWVRDNLGTCAPRIYLCGILDLTDAKRRMLYDRNVTPIDLAPFFPRHRYPVPGMRHRTAMEWLLLSLEEGRPDDPILWPNPAERRDSFPPELPSVLPSEHAKPLREPYSPSSISQGDNSNTAAALKDAAQIWRHNRKLYPGWLIAPYRTRDHLKRFTEQWLNVVVNAVDKVEPHILLEVLDELNWRWETSLCSLTQEFADVMELAIESVNPFPDQSFVPPAKLNASPENLNEYDWPSIIDQWLRLAFAVLRFWREERRRDRVQKWVARLRALHALPSSFKARLCYELCLLYLGFGDSDSVRIELEKWSEEEQDPIWLARKAAIKVEAGDISTAAPLAELALRKVRSQAKGPDDIASLSREGWIILLLRAIDSQRGEQGVAEVPDSRGRLEFLAKFRCDPWAEIEHFQERLQQEQPLRSATPVRRRGFSPGTVTNTVNLGWIQSWTPYQFMRLTEEAPYPPFCGNTHLSHDSLGRIAINLANDDVVRTLSLITRLNSKKLIEAVLTRSRVASLSVETVNEMLESSLVIINEAEASLLQVAGRQDEPRHRKLLIDRFEVGMELLSRLAIRLSPKDCDRLLERSLELFRSEAVRSGRSSPKVLCSLMESVLMPMDHELLSRRILDLMSLPIPGSAGFAVHEPHDWPLIVDILPSITPAKIKRSRQVKWAQEVDKLIGALSESPLQTRGTPAMRLQRLNEYGLLTKRETERFAKALWSGTSEAGELPSLSPFSMLGLMELPEPVPGMAKERVKAHLLNSSIPCFRTERQDVSGKQAAVLTTEGANDQIIGGWLTLTARNQKDVMRPSRIDWSTGEAELIFVKVSAWWESEGRALAMKLPTFNGLDAIMFADPIKDRLQKIVELLRDVLIPRIGLRSAQAKPLQSLIEELHAANVPVHALLPALLKYKIRSVEEVELQLSDGLSSNDELVYLCAVRALVFWVRVNGPIESRPLGYAIPGPTESLLRQFEWNLASRRQPGLLISLDAASRILKGASKNAAQSLAQSACNALDKLTDEASYGIGRGVPKVVDDEDIPAVRERMARLASALLFRFPEYQVRVQRASASLKADPLPEVRSAIALNLEVSD
jgi:hypothetical protein